MSGSDATKAKVPDVAEPVRGPSKEQLRAAFHRMLQLEWITLFFQVFAAALLGLTMGNSQAMKTEWIENAFAIIPAAGVLLTFGTENRKPDHRRPFGYHRTGTIAFAVGAFGLTAFGIYLGCDSLLKLVHREHPSIGGITLLGHTFWHGWLMLAALILTAVPPLLLGRAKLPVARMIHDKALFAEAHMNRANWLTHGAAIVGLLFVGGGLWWGDSLAALLISVDIVRDGVKNAAQCLSDVMDHHPIELGSGRQSPIVHRVKQTVQALPFVADARVLMREHGRYVYAEIFIRPSGKLHSVTEATAKVRQTVLCLDWRLQHVAIEFSDDIDAAAAVLTRRELDIEKA